MLVMRLRRRLRSFLQFVPTLGLWSMAAFWVVGLYAQQQVSQKQDVVLVADVDSLIHPVSAEYIAQTLDRAADEEAELVVLMLKTPGGLVDSTREINTSIIESETPVVVYVGPSGTRAASAGFLITIAADIAAMAPGTHIGAAHPVSATPARYARDFPSIPFDDYSRPGTGERPLNPLSQWQGLFPSGSNPAVNEVLNKVLVQL